jgi:hypothetical protein
MGTIHFLLEIIVSAGFVAVGLLMAVWPSAKLHLCQLAALELANDLLDLGRRTPASPPPYLLFFDHETTSSQNRRAD